MECQGSKIRNFLMIPATCTSFLSQLIVIVDVICGRKNIYRKLRGFFKPNLVTSISNGDMEGIQMSTVSPQPTQLLDQHLVSYWIKSNMAINIQILQKLISLTTGFLTFCLFNLIIFLVSLLGLLVDSWKTGRHGELSWLLALALTPTIWIVRNRNMLQKIIK